LQRNERVDVGGRLWRDGRSCLGRGADVFRQREPARRGPPRARGWRSQRGAVRSVDAHGLVLLTLAGSFAFLWLMRRKHPGKSCREAAVSALQVTAPLTRAPQFYSMKSRKCVISLTWHAARIVNDGCKAMGVAEHPAIREVVRGSRGCTASTR